MHQSIGGEDRDENCQTAKDSALKWRNFSPALTWNYLPH